MQFKIIQEGSIYSIQNTQGEFWLGPRPPNAMQWQGPREPGASVPCWMTTSRESALAQAALLECHLEPTTWSRIADELYKDAELWRTSTEDPHNINYAVSTALRAVSMAISKVI